VIREFIQNRCKVNGITRKWLNPMKSAGNGLARTEHSRHQALSSPKDCPSVGHVQITTSFDPGKKRVLIVDDQPVVRAGLALLINAEPDFVTLCEPSSAPLALDLTRTCPVDIAVLDMSLSGTNGIELIKLLKAEHTQLKIIALSMYKEASSALRVLQAGALGYVVKTEPIEHVLDALHKVARGEIYISPRLSEYGIFAALDELSISSPFKTLSLRELKVFKLLGSGLRRREVAFELNLNIKTIKLHCESVEKKLGFKSADEMVRFALDWFRHERSD
jgi:DNA-binding NarL/FixJ family response regulator